MKISILLLVINIISTNSCKDAGVDSAFKMSASMPMDNELIQSMNKTNATMNSKKINGDFYFSSSYFF